MWKCGRVRKWRESFSRNPWDSRIDLTCGRPHVVGVWLIAGKLINFKGGATCAAFSLTLRACNYTDTLARNGNGETIAAWIVYMVMEIRQWVWNEGNFFSFFARIIDIEYRRLLRSVV